MKVKLLKPLKTSERLIPRGEVVDLPKAQAESYLARNLAVPPGVDVDEESPPTPNAPEAPPPEEPAEVEPEPDPPLDKGGTPLPVWELKYSPIEYVDRFDADAPNTELAQKYIRAKHGDYKPKE
jgi:hypothetical protein